MRSIGSYLARTVWLALLPFSVGFSGLVIAIWVSTTDTALTLGLVAGGVLASIWTAWVSYRSARRLRLAVSLLGSELQVTDDKLNTISQEGDLLIAELAAVRRSRLQQSLQEIQACEQERFRLRSELHDLVQQNLGGLLNRLDLLNSAASPLPPSSTALFTQTRDLAQSAIAQIDLTVQHVRPWALDLLGLAPALTQLTDHMQRRCGLQIELEWVGDETVAHHLSRPITDCIYRTIESNLHLARMYRNASFTHVVIDTPTKGQFIVQLSDDGNRVLLEGLPATYLCEANNMAAHVSALGGTLYMHPSDLVAQEEGATVIVRIPLGI